MRTLYEILMAAKRGEDATDAELRCALVVMDALETFSGLAVKALAKGHFLGDMYMRQRFERNKRALGSDPQRWLGPGRDLTIPGNQARVRQNQDAVCKLLEEGENGG